MKTLTSRISNFFGIALLCMAMAFFTACPPEPEPPDPTFPEPKGKLTVTGLSSFNDKYVYVQGLAGGKVLVGLTDITGYPSDITYKLVKISGGEAVVPLYYANSSADSYENSFIAYNGNDTLNQNSQLSIIIISDSTLKSSNAANAIGNNLGRKNISSTSFSNGNLTFDWDYDPYLEDYVFLYGFTNNFGDDWESYVITNYTGNGGDIVIPSQYKGLPIIAIGANAFKNKNLTSVVLPQNMDAYAPRWGNNINEGAFTLNPNLTSITIGTGVSLNITAFDNNFREVYSDQYNRAAGTYTRTIGTDNWVKVK